MEPMLRSVESAISVMLKNTSAQYLRIKRLQEIIDHCKRLKGEQQSTTTDAVGTTGGKATVASALVAVALLAASPAAGQDDPLPEPVGGPGAWVGDSQLGSTHGFHVPGYSPLPDCPGPADQGSGEIPVDPFFYARRVPVPQAPPTPDLPSDAAQLLWCDGAGVWHTIVDAPLGLFHVMPDCTVALQGKKARRWTKESDGVVSCVCDGLEWQNDPQAHQDDATTLCQAGPIR